jgi:hypothetical protein
MHSTILEEVIRNSSAVSGMHSMIKEELNLIRTTFFILDLL